MSLQTITEVNEGIPDAVRSVYEKERLRRARLRIARLRQRMYASAALLRVDNKTDHHTAGSGLKGSVHSHRSKRMFSVTPSIIGLLCSALEY